METRKQEVEEITIQGLTSMTLHVTSCQVSVKARMIRHPVESGSTVFDDKVLDPRVITIHADVYADEGNAKNYLRRLWRNRNFKFYTIVTREATYNNFCCTECSHTESKEKLDMLQYTITFEEVMKAQGRAKAGSSEDENCVINS